MCLKARRRHHHPSLKPAGHLPAATADMASLRLGAPARGLRTLQASRKAPATIAATSTRCYGTDIEPERPKAPRQGNEARLGRSFQGQVMGSIGHRLQRERDERQQYEQWRHVTDPGRNWSATVCKSGLMLLVPIRPICGITERRRRYADTGTIKSSSAALAFHTT